MRNKRTYGFTLIELLVVVAIVAILAAIVVGGLSRLSHRSTTSVDVPEPATNVEKTGRSPGAYQIYTIPLDIGFSYESTKVKDVLVEWLKEHPTEKIISIIRCSGKSGADIVIVSFKEAPPK